MSPMVYICCECDPDPALDGMPGTVLIAKLCDVHARCWHRVLTRSEDGALHPIAQAPPLRKPVDSQDVTRLLGATALRGFSRASIQRANLFDSDQPAIVRPRDPFSPGA